MLAFNSLNRQVLMGDLIVDILIESTIAFEHDLGELTSEVTVAVMESVNNYIGFSPG